MVHRHGLFFIIIVCFLQTMTMSIILYTKHHEIFIEIDLNISEFDNTITLLPQVGSVEVHVKSSIQTLVASPCIDVPRAHVNVETVCVPFVIVVILPLAGDDRVSHSSEMIINMYNTFKWHYAPLHNTAKIKMFLN